MNFLYRPDSMEYLKKTVNDPTVSLGHIDTSLITDMSELFVESDRENFAGIEN